MPELRRRSFAVRVAVVVTAAAAVAGCSSSTKNQSSPTTLPSGGGSTTTASADTPINGGTLTFTHETDPSSLDPTAMTSFSSFGGTDMFFDAYGALLVSDTLAKPPTISPLLAQSMTSPDNGSTWVLKLRPNLVFSDGTPFDAAAVQSNWTRLGDPANHSPMAVDMADVGSMTVSDPQTLTIKLKTPNTLFPNTVAESAMSYIASPTALQKEGKNFGTQPVGGGPFVLKSWVQGNHSVWAKNPSYFAAASVHLDGLQTLQIIDNTSQENAFSTGQANMVSCPQQPVVTAIQKAGGVVNEFPQLGNISITWNVKKPPFDSEAMRVAFTQAINRDAVAQAWAGAPDPQPKGLLRQDSPYYDPNAAYPSYDPAAAQAAVNSYVAANGPINLTFLFTAGNQAVQNAALVAQQELQQLKGVHVTLTSLDLGSYVTYLFSGKWNLSFNGLSYPNIADPTFENLFATTGALNSAGFSDPVVDQALQDSRSTTDPAQQQKDYNTVQEQLTKDAFFAPDVTTNNYICSAKNVHGYWFADGVPRTDLIWIGK
jgi:peptide/nickel transport system substrate-binding protein